SNVRLFAATRGYYVEFNRAAPFDLDVDGVAFPLSATVHSDDAATIADNVRAIVDMANTVREVTHLREIAIAPLALYFPPRASESAFPAEAFEPWLRQTLKYAREAGVGSITFAPDVVAALRAQPFAWEQP